MDESNNASKSQLMAAVKEILKAKEKAIAILKNTSTNNIRSIERNSRNVKDPNPLITAMSNMACKYPLAVKKDSVINYGVPTHLLGPEDSHLHGRILASYKLIDWWIQEAGEPSEAAKEVIQVLCRKHDQSVADYYKIDWANMSFQFGRVELERTFIRTQKPIAELPPSIRNEAIIQAFLPDSSIQREYIDKSILDTLKSKMGELTSPHMTWASQLRIIKTQLDPKVRCLPTLTGMNDEVAELKHALLHVNFKAQRLPSSSIVASTQGLKLISQHMCNRIRLHKYTVGDAIECMNATLIEGKTLSAILKDPATITSEPHILFLKCLLGEKVSMTTNIGGVDFSPYPCKVKIVTRENRSRAPYKVYLGAERVSFRSGHCRGNFLHEGPLLVSMVSNAPNKLLLLQTIVNVATYCRHNYDNTHAKFPSKMKAEASALTKKKPQDFLRVNEEQWLSWVPNHQAVIGPLRIDENVEYQEAPPTYLSPDDDLNMVCRHTGQKVGLPPIPRNLPPLPAIVDSASPVLMDVLYPSKLLRRKVRFFHTNMSLLLDRIARDRWDWHNASISQYLPGGIKANIAACAVNFIKMAVSNPSYNKLLICFWYCFTSEYTGSFHPTMVFLYNDVDTVSLKVDEGIAQISNSGNLIIYGKELIVSESGHTDTGRLMTGIIPGFRFSQYIPERFPVKSLRTLHENRETIPQGTKSIVWIAGEKYLAIRDEMIKYQVDRTIQRHLDFFYSQSVEPSSIVTLKRKY